MEAAKTITPTTSSSHSELSAALECCSRALSDLETFLTPGYVQPTSGVKYSLDQCSQMASMLAQHSTIPINLLAVHLVRCRLHVLEEMCIQALQCGSNLPTVICQSRCSIGKTWSRDNKAMVPFPHACSKPRALC